MSNPTGAPIRRLVVRVAGNMVVEVPEGFRVFYAEVDPEGLYGPARPALTGHFKYPSGVLYNGRYELTVEPVPPPEPECDHCGGPCSGGDA